MKTIYLCVDCAHYEAGFASFVRHQCHRGAKDCVDLVTGEDFEDGVLDCRKERDNWKGSFDAMFADRCGPQAVYFVRTPKAPS